MEAAALAMVSSNDSVPASSATAAFVWTTSLIRSATRWATLLSTPVRTTTTSDVVHRTTKSLPRTTVARMSSTAGTSSGRRGVIANSKALSGR